jgi:hypothetical protein
MSVKWNRILDVVGSFAIVALGLALSGATAVIGV